VPLRRHSRGACACSNAGADKNNDRANDRAAATGDNRRAAGDDHNSRDGGLPIPK
jgi:hypothetical protein